ncbi:MAG: hypothetical protein ABIN67_04660 [Ferruginibacter sp.]
MKLTSKILTAMLLLFVAGLFISNSILKNEYNKVDRNDLYWNYGKILEQPFSHIKIEGGNITNIAFEQSINPSVRIFKDWEGYQKGSVKAVVKNDTLFLKFPNTYRDIFEKNWMGRTTLVRIFCPRLLSFTGNNSKFEMFKVKQKNMSVTLTGKSGFELESMNTEMDSLYISQQDSSAVVFEMSPDYKITESFRVKNVNASIRGVSVLDLGHAQIDSLKLTIADSSAILLSGGTLKKRK